MLLELTIECRFCFLCCFLVVVRRNNVLRQVALAAVRMNLVGSQALFDSIDLIDRHGRSQTVVLHHQFIGNRHYLAEHIIRSIGKADVVAVALGHLLNAIGALQQRKRQAHLGLHAHLFHKLTASKQVEQLVGAAQLNICLDNHRVICLHDGIQELVEADWQLGRVAVMEVIALENASNGEVGSDLQKVFHAQGKNPFGIITKGGLFGVKNLEGLVNVSLSVFLNLFTRKLRTRGVAAGRVADKGGSVTDDKGNLMAQILELTQLAQRDGMAQMDIGSRRVYAQLDVQRLTALKFVHKGLLRHDLSGTGLNDMKLLFR